MHVSKETTVSHRGDRRSTLKQQKLQDKKDQVLRRGYLGYSLYFNFQVNKVTEYCIMI